MMRRMLMAGIACALSPVALAQYQGPAVDACRAFAKRELERDGTRAKDIVFERDYELSLDRYGRKLGNQFVASILRGNGAVVLDGAPSAELSFVCLLADEKRALFFEWLPRRNPLPLAQCTRDDAMRANPQPCLQTLLQVAENDLTQAYASRFQDARERDHGNAKELHTDLFRKSNDEWKQYRDAECARRRDAAPQAAVPDSHELACRVELTRRRIIDMR